MARCVACGAPRTPLSAGSLTYAGKTSQVGGLVARIFGWIALVLGLLGTLITRWIASEVWPGTAAPWIVGGVAFALTMVIALPLLLGGRKLESDGVKKEDNTRMQALFALAANRGGALRAHEAASALGVPSADADALLTRLAKERPDDVTLDVTEQGELVYGFPRLAPPGRSWNAGWGLRIEAERPPGPRVAPPAQTVRVVDADFEEIEEQASKVLRARS